jgi:hypothetical protein
MLKTETLVSIIKKREYCLTCRGKVSILQHIMLLLIPCGVLSSKAFSFELKSLVSLLLKPFSGAKYSIRTVAVPSAQGRTVRAQGSDIPWPGARRGGALCTEADGPCAGAGWSASWCEARAPV